MANTCRRLFDSLVGTNRPTWRSAICGMMPIALVVLIIDLALMTVAIGAAITEGYIDDRKPYVLPCSSLTFTVSTFGSIASLGVFSQKVNTALSRAAFFLASLTLLTIFITVPMAVVGFLQRYLDNVLEEQLVDFVVQVALRAVVGFFVAFAVVYYSVQLHRSLYYIIAAGGSGWEYQRADEIQQSKRQLYQEDIEHNPTAPLIGTTDQFGHLTRV